MNHRPDWERWVWCMKWHVKLVQHANGEPLFFLTFRVKKIKKYILYLGHQHIQTYWIVPVFALYASVLQGGGGSQKMISSLILSNSLYMTQLLKHPRRISQAHLHSAMVTSFPVIPLFVPSIFRSWKTSCGASPQRRSPHSCHRTHTHANTEQHRCKLRRRLTVFTAVEPASQTICQAQQLQLRI